MTEYKKKVEIRWSDLDPNFHLRHSVYYDWGAFVRMSFLTEHGLTAAVMMQHHINNKYNHVHKKYRRGGIFCAQFRVYDLV